MKQRWHDLLFMHWPIDAALLRKIVPESLTLDTFDGQAWIGIVPFRMSGIRLRGTPPIPGLSAFPELNVRTYVTRDGKPGVYFFSLDAANLIAVMAAQRWFHLPYEYADMFLRKEDGLIQYLSIRIPHYNSAAQLTMSYRPTGPAVEAAPGSLAYWLTERYCLYAVSPEGKTYRGEILHAPWPLQPAEAKIELNTMTSPIKINLPDIPPLLHFSAYQEVLIWSLERLELGVRHKTKT